MKCPHCGAKTDLGKQEAVKQCPICKTVIWYFELVYGA